MMDGVDADGGLSCVREGGLFFGDLEHIELASLMPAVALIQRDVRRKKRPGSALDRRARVALSLRSPATRAARTRTSVVSTAL